MSSPSFPCVNSVADGGAMSGSRRRISTAARARTTITTRSGSSTTTKLLLEPPRERAQRQVGAADQAWPCRDDRPDRRQGGHPGHRHAPAQRRLTKRWVPQVVRLRFNSKAQERQKGRNANDCGDGGEYEAGIRQSPAVFSSRVDLTQRDHPEREAQDAQYSDRREKQREPARGRPEDA
jgi:hypothetical protein